MSFRKSFLRYFFLLLVPLLCAQLVFIKIYEEPFPSVRFPGFGIVYSSAYPQTYSGLRVAIYSETDSVRYTLNQFLAPTPQYAKVFFLSMGKKLKKLPSHLDAQRASAKEQELMTYFHDKALANTGFSSISFLELKWYRFRVDQPNKPPKATLIDKKTITYGEL
jgi:hypothetical protein